MKEIYIVKVQMKRRLLFKTYYTSTTQIFGRYLNKETAERVAKEYQKELDRLTLHNLFKKLVYRIDKVQIETEYI